MLVYRHPRDWRNGAPVTVERPARDPELEFYGWTVDSGTPESDEPAVERKPRRRAVKPKPADEQDAGDDTVEE